MMVEALRSMQWSLTLSDLLPGCECCMSITLYHTPTCVVLLASLPVNASQYGHDNLSFIGGGVGLDPTSLRSSIQDIVGEIQHSYSIHHAVF